MRVSFSLQIDIAITFGSNDGVLVDQRKTF